MNVSSEIDKNSVRSQKKSLEHSNGILCDCFESIESEYIFVVASTAAHFDKRDFLNVSKNVNSLRIPE